MTWFADLEPLTYFGEGLGRVLRAVGWLDRAHKFAQGEIAARTFDSLRELARDPFQPLASGGTHQCNLCQFEPEAAGSANLFVPGRELLYVCPTLITHYVNAHGYRPPTEFCEAVLQCPGTRTIEYKRRFLDNGGRLVLEAG